MSKLNLGAVGGEYPESQEIVEVGQVYDLDIIRPKFEDYKKEAVRIATDAKALEVKDDESLNLAVMIGGNAKKIVKAIDAKRKEIILEPAEFVKGVNAMCKMITDNLDEAERVTKQKIGQHQARIEMERRKQEEAARKAAAELQAKLQAEADEANRKAREAAAKLAEEEARKAGAKKAEIEAARKKAEDEARKHEIQAPTVVAPVIPEAQKAVRTEEGSAHQRKVWSYEVMDAALVPVEYKIVNEQSIRDAIKMGVREITGVRIFEEVKTVFRT
ncbi:MAG: hypothetical protein ABIJ57_14770 [Pseudomonadota bacterium]